MFGYMQTAVVPMVLEIAPEAAEVLRKMPLPSYSSYQLVLQVSVIKLSCWACLGLTTLHACVCTWLYMYT